MDKHNFEPGKINKCQICNSINLIEVMKLGDQPLANSLIKDISDKYIDPPNTTDFAVMFLPVEGLYAEAIRDVGLFNTLRSKYNITSRYCCYILNATSLKAIDV